MVILDASNLHKAPLRQTVWLVYNDRAYDKENH